MDASFKDQYIALRDGKNMFNVAGRSIVVRQGADDFTTQSDDGGAGIAADDLSAALQGMTVTVEEGVMGCGDETCGSGADGGCDPLECMRRAGGPFKLSLIHI